MGTAEGSPVGSDVGSEEGDPLGLLDGIELG